MKRTMAKVMAGLGVVAGLGVAVLPLSAYAADDILISVQISPSDETGTCSDTTCEGGGNNPTGYTVTITDKDGVKFNLDNNTNNAGANDNAGSSSTTGTIVTIAAATATVSGTNVYGVKFIPNTTNISSGAYAGSYTYGTIVSGQFNPIAATVGTISTAGPGSFAVDHATGYSVDNSLPAGTYTNTLSIVFAANS